MNKNKKEEVVQRRVVVTYYGDNGTSVQRVINTSLDAYQVKSVFPLTPAFQKAKVP